MIFIGLQSIGRLNKQFFPDFDIDIVAVSIDWPGAASVTIKYHHKVVVSQKK